MRFKALMLGALLLATPAAGEVNVNELLGRAEKGDATAQTVIGLMYLRGEQFAPDEKTAARWLQRAARQDTFIARYALGTLLCPSCVPTPDYAEAAERYRAAAEHGSPLAQANLAVMLTEGRGMRRDPVEALMWYELAARAEQEGIAALAARERDALAATLTAQQVTAARAQAAAFKPKR